MKAIVEFFGGMPEELHGFTRMPPVLILHGEQDRVVPVSEATRLQRLLERTNTPNEMKLYPGADTASMALSFVTRVNERFSSCDAICEAQCVDEVGRTLGQSFLEVFDEN